MWIPVPSSSRVLGQRIISSGNAKASRRVELPGVEPGSSDEILHCIRPFPEAGSLEHLSFQQSGRLSGHCQHCPCAWG
jgi:hypothetical protein